MYLRICAKIKKSFRLLAILAQLILVLTTTSCGGSGGGASTKESTTSAVASSSQGKLAQGYVSGAQVWYDLVEQNGLGNLQRDPGEVDTLSAFDGSYSLGGLEGKGLLVTMGGIFLNSKGRK